MTTPPETELEVTPQEAQAIRAAVQRADPNTYDSTRALAALEHAEGLTQLLSDPLVSGPMFDLPKPIEISTIAAWVQACQAARERGEGLLMLMHDEAGAIAGYSKITVWPERSAAELAGAIRADRQGAGQGGASAWRTIHWMFETLNVRLIALTADPDNIRTARLIEAMGFQRLGDRLVVCEDGTERPSLYWEMTRDAWRGPSA